MKKIVPSLIILISCFTLASCCSSQKKQIAKADSSKQTNKCNCGINYASAPGQKEQCNCGTNCTCASGQNEQCNCTASCKEASKK